MRVGARMGPLFVSARPTSILVAPLYIFYIPIWLAVVAAIGAVWLLAHLLIGALWLLTQGVKALAWVIRHGLGGIFKAIGGIFKAVWWLLVLPVRLLLVWPVRAWRRHRARKHTARAFAQPPLGPRIAA